MITSKDCYLRNSCYKYVTNKSCVEQDIYCPKLLKLNFLYDQAQLTKKQRIHTAIRIDDDNTDEKEFNRLSEIEKNIESWISHGNNLYIHSSITGNGKTLWSIRLMQSYFGKIWHKTDFECRGLFINVPRFFISLKENIDKKTEYVNQIKENIETADLIIWDEIGTKQLTAFEHENLLSYINMRVDNGKSNIYTSNLSSEELKTVVGDRLYSRIVNLSEDIELHGQDKRGLN